jgi:hypothetical protein
VIRRHLLRLAGALTAAAMFGMAPAAVRAQTSASDCQQVLDQDNLVVVLCTPPNRTSSTATYPLTVKVSNTAKFLGNSFNVTSVKAEVATTTDSQLLPDPSSAQVTGGSTPTATLNWSPEFPTNGPYDLRLSATGDRPNGQSASVSVPITLAAPPHRPTGVQAKVTSEGKVTITWENDDREPDLLYYEISRAAQGSGKYESLNFVDASISTYTDSPAVGGWRYRVTAVRRGATPDQGLTSTPSADATAEVSAPPSTTTTAAGGSTGSGSGSTGSGTGTGSGTTGSTLRSGASSSTSLPPSISNAPRSTIDLAALNAARRTPPKTTRTTEPDPGFSELLPFDKQAADDQAEDGPAELGADEPAVGLGERLVSDGGERRRSLGFVAGGLLLFVLGMTGLFLKSEVKRADELDPIDLDAADPPNLAPAAAVDELMVAAPSSAEPVPVAAVADEPVPVVTVADESPVDVADADLPVIAPAARRGPVGSRLPSRRRPAAERTSRPAGAVATADATVPIRPSAAAELVAESIPWAVAAVAPAAEAAPSRPSRLLRRGRPAPAPVETSPSVDEATAEPTLTPVSRLTRARQARAAERAAEIAALFEGEAPHTADANAAHLAALADADTDADADAVVPAARRRPVRHTVAPLDDPSLDVPNPVAPARPKPAAAAGAATRPKRPATTATGTTAGRARPAAATAPPRRPGPRPTGNRTGGTRTTTSAGTRTSTTPARRR